MNFFYLRLDNIYKYKNNVFFWMFQMLSAVSADFLIKYLNLPKKHVRIIYNILGFIITMISIISLGFISCDNKYYAVILLTTGVAFR